MQLLWTTDYTFSRLVRNCPVIERRWCHLNQLSVCVRREQQQQLNEDNGDLFGNCHHHPTRACWSGEAVSADQLRRRVQGLSDVLLDTGRSQVC